jgi:nicotinamide phosphoribosyltransferase
MNNIIMDTDSYKSSHFLQYPPGTDYMFDYIESRGGKYDSTVFFGLQYLMKEYLTKIVTMEMVEEAKTFFEGHGEPFPYEGWKYIATELKGKLPIRIRAVAEGTVVPTHNALMTVESTDPKVFWIVSWLETMLLRVWYPITVATQSHSIKQVIKGFLDDTADNTEAEIAFKLHDFGARGVSSRESAAIGGASHLVNFMGSDTCAGVWMANKYYNAGMAGFSIPAAEHSTITSWGKENEVDAFRNMLTQFAKPGSLVAIVSDSYDLAHAVENLWGGELRQEVIDSGATVIIRPDSGDPAQMVKMTLWLLDKKFGHTVNSKGFKVLNNVRVIQGDGINQESITEILTLAKKNGFSATNIAFGMGGALLQQVNRDTLSFAMKCSAVRVDGKHVTVWKDPVTDPGKKSKKGFVDLVRLCNGDWHTIDGCANPENDNSAISQLRVVFENGEILIEDNLEAIRARANEV